METFDFNKVLDQIEGNSAELIRADAVSVEVMKFEEGEKDQQHAHGEDEVYYINSGTAKLSVEGESTEVSEGDVIHLEPGTEHRFHDFKDELVTTVLYAPAKGSTE